MWLVYCCYGFAVDFVFGARNSQGQIELLAQEERFIVSASLHQGKWSLFLLKSYVIKKKMKPGTSITIRNPDGKLQSHL